MLQDQDAQLYFRFKIYILKCKSTGKFCAIRLGLSKLIDFIQYYAVNDQSKSFVSQEDTTIFQPARDLFQVAR